MGRRSFPWPLAVVAGVGLAVFAVITIALTTNPSLAVDARAFDIADDLREPWLDHVARVITTLGLIAIVGPALLIGAALLLRRGRLSRSVALVAGGALTWIAVYTVKLAVDRARPPRPLIHTAGASYPSAHAANSVGWLALAIALTVTIAGRGGRIVVVACGAAIAVLVGLSRIYLRAHYASDVFAGEALAVAMYSLVALGRWAWESGRDQPAQSPVPPAGS